MSKQIELSITVKEKLVESKKRIDDATKAIAGLQAELKKLEKQQDDLGAQEKRGLITAAQRIESGKEIDKQIKTLNSQLDKQIVEQAKANAEYESTYEVLKKLTAQQQALDNVTSGVSMSLDEMKENLASIKGIKGQPTEISAEITTAAKELESKIKEYEKLEKSLNKQVQDLKKSMTELVKSTKEEMLKKLEMEKEAKFLINDFERDLMKSRGDSDTKLADNTLDRVAIEKKHNKERADIIAKYDKRIYEEWVEINQKKYEEDLKLCENNEAKKLELQKTLYNNLKYIYSENGVDTKEIDAKIKELEKQEKEILDNRIKALDENAEKEKAIAADKGKSTLKIDRDILAEKLSLYNTDSKEYYATLSKKAEADKKYYEEIMNRVKTYADMAKSLYNEVLNFMKAEDENELKRLDEKSKQEKETLKSELEDKEITQIQYNEKTKKIDADLDKKKAEIKRKQVAREKAVKIYEVIINTASAYVKALPNLALAGVTAMMGAVQLGVVMATPLPKAATDRKSTRLNSSH